jgi:transcriptional regulator with XRE-family HTH domain
MDPRYSVRRFARRLGVHHSTVSRLLRGNRVVPSRTLRRIADRLGMSDGQAGTFQMREDSVAVAGAIGRRSFRPDTRWLARVAGISADRVNIVLQFLLRCGALKMVSVDRWELVEKESE